MLHVVSYKEANEKVLVRLRECAGWSANLLFVCNKDILTQGGAYLVIVFIVCQIIFAGGWVLRFYDGSTHL